MKVLILTNNDVGLYKFRRELLEALLRERHEVTVAMPYGGYVPQIEAMGCRYCETPFERHGTNPFAELRLLRTYERLIKRLAPDVVLTYTIKPNVYGGMACARLGVPYIATVTGLHGAVEESGLLQKITLSLYRFGLRRAKRVFFQNEKNLTFMLRHRVVTTVYELVRGSGVNLEQNCFEPYPEERKRLIFLVIGRVMKVKGTEEVLIAAEKIARAYPDVLFRFVGDYEEDEKELFRERMEKAISAGYVDFVGPQDDVHGFIKNSHATVHASYREGMSNVLLESAAAGRPVIATDISGCRETFDDGKTGLACRPRDAEDLVCAIHEFIGLPHEQKAAMGRAGREKMEREFDRRIVVDAYMKEIHEIEESSHGAL